MSLAAALAVTGCSAPEATSTAAATALRPAPRSGEPTACSVLLQARLSAAEQEPGAPVLRGIDGVVRFELAANPAFRGSRHTEWQRASAATDYVVRARIDDLAAGTTWYWRVHHGTSPGEAAVGPTHRTRTLPGPVADTAVRFVVTTCMHRHRFLTDEAGYRDDAEDRHLGFPSFRNIAALAPLFVCFTGDCVYYDHPQDARATDRTGMRDRWHRQFDTPNSHVLLGECGGYWLKDDHDFRYDDADRTGERPPTVADGKAVFREQAPVSLLDRPDQPMWRTHRINRDVQIWLLEGRDHRSPNRMTDGPDKTLWGRAQRAWLQETLRASDARFRILISPTPLVGPDDRRKKDNHTNIGGFQFERDAFLAWARGQELIGTDAAEGRLLVICGDRHWQYHSVHPAGLHEFSCGAASDGNARAGRRPGDPRGTDPDGLIDQRWTQPKVSGGFLQIDSDPERDRLEIVFRDDHGRRLHGVTYEPSRRTDAK